MEFVDNETALKRAESIELLQAGIMDDYNASMMGKTLEILVDGYDEELEQFYGRSYADSPDIDGRVWLASQEPLSEGKFVTVQIDGCIDGDLSGFVLEEE
jgi:ribosomal protein S12 methylthiotransferase